MATNPLGPGKTTLTIYIDANLFIEVAKLAGYARAIVQSAVANQLLVRKNPEDERAYFASIGKPGEKPPIRLEVVALQPLNILHLPSSAAPYATMLETETAHAAEDAGKYKAKKSPKKS